MNQNVTLPVDSAQEATALVAALFERHHREIYAYLVRLLDDPEWATDLTQEVFLQLVADHAQLTDIQNHRAWIYRIAGNKALNALKRRKRFAWLPWKANDSMGIAHPRPDETVETHTAVRSALMQLPPNYRIPLLLYAHEGFHVREIATILQISEGAVKNRLYRAREQFRQIYERENGA